MENLRLSGVISHQGSLSRIQVDFNVLSLTPPSLTLSLSRTYTFSQINYPCLSALFIVLKVGLGGGRIEGHKSL